MAPGRLGFDYWDVGFRALNPKPLGFSKVSVQALNGLLSFGLQRRRLAKHGFL